MPTSRCRARRRSTTAPRSSTRAPIEYPRVTDVTILRPQRIPIYIADGLFDIGITARDWIEETGAEVTSLAELNYSKETAQPTRIVLAVSGEATYKSVSDLPPG